MYSSTLESLNLGTNKSVFAEIPRNRQGKGPTSHCRTRAKSWYQLRLGVCNAEFLTELVAPQATVADYARCRRHDFLFLSWKDRLNSRLCNA